ncbi:hypothetical protein VKT23_019978 [Stygiomarasmius scandens]|uniref:Uncharacterized protein n=1 Tax=Marasmiellus scandens TaxID=2682957 RepID=A0ABR1IM85_9AGAR
MTSKRKRGVIHTVTDLSDDEDVNKLSSTPAQLVIPHSDYSTSRKDPKCQLICHSLQSDETPALFSSTAANQPKIPKSNTLPALDRFLLLSDAFESEIPGTDDTDGEMVKGGHMDDSDSDDSDESDREGSDTVGKEKRKRKA